MKNRSKKEINGNADVPKKGMVRPTNNVETTNAVLIRTGYM